MKKLLITILLTILLVTPALADDCDRCHSDHSLQYNALQFAYENEGITELTNKNDGPEITEWLATAGLGPGYPYCAAFMYSMYKKSRDFLQQDLTIPYRSARVSTIYYAAKRNPVKYQVITPNQVALSIYELEPGDIPIWTTSDDGVYNFNGHTGLVIEPVGASKFKTIEANTRSSNKGDQREGGGVFYKTRLTKDYNFKLKAIIRLRD